jgi:hypothetical protein
MLAPIRAPQPPVGAHTAGSAAEAFEIAFFLLVTSSPIVALPSASEHENEHEHEHQHAAARSQRVRREMLRAHASVAVASALPVKLDTAHLFPSLDSLADVQRHVSASSLLALVRVCEQRAPLSLLEAQLAAAGCQFSATADALLVREPAYYLIDVAAGAGEPAGGFAGESDVAALGNSSVSLGFAAWPLRGERSHDQPLRSASSAAAAADLVGGRWCVKLHHPSLARIAHLVRPALACDGAGATRGDLELPATCWDDASACVCLVYSRVSPVSALRALCHVHETVMALNYALLLCGALRHPACAVASVAHSSVSLSVAATEIAAIRFACHALPELGAAVDTDAILVSLVASHVSPPALDSFCVFLGERLQSCSATMHWRLSHRIDADADADAVAVAPLAAAVAFRPLIDLVADLCAAHQYVAHADDINRSLVDACALSMGDAAASEIRHGVVSLAARGVSQASVWMCFGGGSAAAPVSFRCDLALHAAAGTFSLVHPATDRVSDALAAAPHASAAAGALWRNVDLRQQLSTPESTACADFPASVMRAYARCGVDVLLGVLSQAAAAAPRRATVAATSTWADVLADTAGAHVAVTHGGGADVESAAAASALALAPAASLKRRGSQKPRAAEASAATSASTAAANAAPTLTLRFAPASPFQLRPELQEFAPAMTQFFHRFVCAPPFDAIACQSFFLLLCIPWPFLADVSAVCLQQVVCWSAHDAEAAVAAGAGDLLTFRLCLHLDGADRCAYSEADSTLRVTVEFGAARAAAAPAAPRGATVRLPLCHANVGPKNRALRLRRPHGDAEVSRSKSLAASLLELRRKSVRELGDMLL